MKPGDEVTLENHPMKIHRLVVKDRAKLLLMLIKTRAFTFQEIDVAMELIDLVLKDSIQKDYRIHCIGGEEDSIIGYICYGPTPMTRGTYDLYWVAVDPDFQKQGVGSTLLEFLEEVVKREGGRLILADTSTLPHYEKTQRFYLKNGFQEVARVPDYYHPGNDRITFCKRIT